MINFRSTLQSSFVKYVLVGLVSNIFLYSAYIGITELGIGSKLAMSVLYALGIIQTFFFNKKWSFSFSEKSESVFLRYCACYAFGYLFNLLALCLLVDYAGYPHKVVQGVLILLLAVILFFLQKFWVFRAVS